MTQWQDISTAPLGVDVLICEIWNEGKYPASYAVGYRLKSNDYKGRPHFDISGASGHDMDTDIRPTHWMPLPEPPKE